MRTVSAREANQQFSKLLEEAVGGEEVTITRRGVPVAKLVPVGDAGAGAEREDRKAVALAWLRDGGLRGGVVADWTREELYEERLEHHWRREE
ncbi:MAG: type II toxin-antitoxin system Phd/YefM family antitoxin [Geminicoccaceae bacterium]|jgi:prevent-host-death family protein